MDSFNQAFMDFLAHAPTAYQTVALIADHLKQKGFVPLEEGQVWYLQRGGSYYVIRNHSSLIAFTIGRQLKNYGFHIVAAHSDSPTYKIKENGELSSPNYLRLNTESYGGIIDMTWLDRPLSVAGRLIVRQGDALKIKLIQVDEDLLLIPSIAIHQNRNVNEGYKFNKQIDLMPLLGDHTSELGDFMQIIARHAHVKAEDIIGHDLYLYNRQKPSVWGHQQAFISAPRLDDLQCVFAAMQGMDRDCHPDTINVLAIFDHEEVGSRSRQGAASTFLKDTLKRINTKLGYTQEEYLQAVARSFMFCCDNTHAVHPNHPELADPSNRVYMNQGVVVKSQAKQKYCSDGLTTAVFKELALHAGISLQFFANRSDQPGGSTLGNIAQAQVSLMSVDIGLAQLAMHSAYETSGLHDIHDLLAVIRTFYTSHISCRNDMIQINRASFFNQEDT